MYHPGVSNLDNERILDDDQRPYPSLSDSSVSQGMAVYFELQVHPYYFVIKIIYSKEKRDNYK